MILKYVVNDKSQYKTVREVLRAEFNMSQRLITKLKLNNLILVNDSTTFIDKQIKVNDVITCNLDLKEDSSNIAPMEMNLDIIYEDDAFLIINKSPGISIHPSILHYDDSLSNGVKHYFNKLNIQKKIRPVTRLDKDTSGLVVFAKNEYIQECLIKQMTSKIFIKKYLALLTGNLSSSKGTINAPIARKDGSIIERCIKPNGAISITHYNLIKNFSDYCLVEFTLETGRTHQIRVHSSYIGHPILGDTLYGKVASNISRQALHCYKLNFEHPITRKKLNFEISLPDDMEKLINPKEK